MWTKTSKNMPPFHERVLVVVDQGKGKFITTAQRKQMPEVWDVYGYGTFPLERIQEWMYLPALPEEVYE